MSQLALLIEDDSKLLLFFVLFDLQSLLEPRIKKSNKSRPGPGLTHRTEQFYSMFYS